MAHAHDQMSCYNVLLDFHLCKKYREVSSHLLCIVVVCTGVYVVGVSIICGCIIVIHR